MPNEYMTLTEYRLQLGLGEKNDLCIVYDKYERVCLVGVVRCGGEIVMLGLEPLLSGR